jgi:DNA polymerase/3'-5' exonuclease PolX
MGICKLDDKHPARRIDIKAYPLDQYGFALLYFTGSGNFNRSMRLFA